MPEKNLQRPMSRIQGFPGGVCVILLLGLLGFGLWPFNFFAKNKAAWLDGQHGIHFDEYGQAYSTSPWKLPVDTVITGKASITIELWVHPWRKKYPHFSAIFFVDHVVESKNFAIIQSGPDLLVQAPFVDQNNQLAVRRIWMDDACLKGEPRFITLTSGEEGSTLYLDGIPQKHFSFTLISDSLRGRVLLGHPPEGHQAWTGDILGLAVYNRVLSGGDVSQNYGFWKDHRVSALLQGRGLAAIYPLDESSGPLAHNRAGSAPDLLIPKEFKLLHRSILSPEFAFDRSELADVIVNILGFIPFGFFLCAYLRSTRCQGWTKSIVWAVLLGAITSLAIELLQVYLPSRDSSLLDVIDNSLGVALGALLFGWIAKKMRRHLRIAN
jgi:hypothetical protein